MSAATIDLMSVAFSVPMMSPHSLVSSTSSRLKKLPSSLLNTGFEDAIVATLSKVTNTRRNDVFRDRERIVESDVNAIVRFVDWNEI